MSDNREIMNNDNVNEIIGERLILDIKIGLETSIKGTEIVFDYLHFIYYIINVTK